MSGDGGKRAGHVFHGSLETSAQLIRDDENSMEHGMAIGNINVSTVESETMDLGAASLEAQEQHAQVLRAVEAKKRERQLVVPTADEDVKTQLRALGHPICLFGEGKADRRDRLRAILAEIQVDSEEYRLIQQQSEGMDVDEEAGAKPKKRIIEIRTEPIYSIAGKELIATRKRIATFSFQRAQERLGKQRREQDDTEGLLQREIDLLNIGDRVKKFSVSASQIGDRRPLSCCAFNGNVDNVIGTGSFSGVGKLWNSKTYESFGSLYGHEDRITDLQFAPAERNKDLVLTGSADSTAKLWRIDYAAQTNSMEIADEENGTKENRIDPVASFEGHLQRLSHIAWHPTGDCVATTSYDHTWRLWNVETRQELLLQDGHDYPTYALAFHPDGSLAFTGDLAGIGRLWDLRSGKSIHAFLGHPEQVVCADFANDGRLLATGSGDHTARIWDLRQRKSLFILPGHSHLVSQVRFDPTISGFLVTGSYDKSCKVWSTRNGGLLHSLSAHDHLLMDVAIHPSSEYLLTCSYDRTWKLWGISEYS